MATPTLFRRVSGIRFKRYMNKIKEFIKNFFIREGKATTIFIVIGILAVLNFLSYHIFARFDLTENKDYSVSKISKETVRDLDDVVNIKAYFSKNLPTKYLTLTREVKDILDEYMNYSGGRIRVEFIDPSESEDVKNNLAAVGIPILRFNVLKNDAFEVVQGYMGIVIEYGDRQEIIPMVSGTQNLEYDLTLAIKKLVSENMPVLGLVTSHGAPGPDTMNYALSALKKLYQIREIDLKSEDGIGGDIETLLVIGLKENLGEDELKKIDDFIMASKPVLFLVDGVRVEQNLLVNKNEIDLEKLLDEYGLTLNKNLISDISCGRASFSQEFLTFMIDYPLWPKILPDNFDNNSVMVAGLGSLMLPWASSVDASEKEGLDIFYLAKSTSDAWAQEDNFRLNPQDNFRSGGEGGQYNLALFVSGKLKSPFGRGETENGKIILIGDSDFILDMFLEQNGDNLIFFQNLVDGLSLDEDLIKIRSQGVIARPIKPLETGIKETLRYINIFGMTVLVLIFGLWRYFWRRRKSNNI